MFELLETFMAVYENNNFTKAANELFVSQPTISVHIEKLEKQIGVVLFERTGNKKIIPTSAAHLLYKNTRKAQNNWNNIINEVVSLGNGSNRILKISASKTIGDYIIPKIWYELQKEYPNINFEITITNSENVFQSVYMLDADIGLVESPLVFPDIDRKEFMHDKLVILGNPELQKWFLREEGSGIRRYSDIYMMQQNILPEFILTINSNAAIMRLVEQGYGATVQSSLIDHPNTIRREETTLVRPLYLISNRNHPNLDDNIMQTIWHLLTCIKKG
ncbi:LysR family transcriptional regulator [Listeria rocourtiae]|uniref:LysR family transcriptional regulator n=1 Tax=Listeria rocourtiae TaxID=647910 RepID=UPI001624CA48|nr:LysR family transcriptional regulator [Listeria rocourtiae]MBC1436376.1 LysR family transcriptional regulator [Listeria rocourtiae]